MNIQICPPAPERNSLRFDRFQFQWSRLRHVPVASSELATMHHSRITNAHRSPTPAWALDDAKTREVVLKYLESRFYLPASDKPANERLDRVRSYVQKKSAAKKALAEKWEDHFWALREERYTDLPESGYATLFLALLGGRTLNDRMRQVESEAKGVAADFSNSMRAAEIAVGVVHFSYRMGWPSPSVAEQLRVTAPAVRQILRRLNAAAKRVNKAPCHS